MVMLPLSPMKTSAPPERVSAKPRPKIRTVTVLSTMSAPTPAITKPRPSPTEIQSSPPVAAVVSELARMPVPPEST